ncbi:hypothetical protein ADICEAN_01169 [Cesiribacter andamanensis AMV16]|uniref:Uncharacterized protein n=1 Tax=Cesiribacter andamanensis AMV16 TaxID=1279009 RepID=M7NPU7_9BACT|nr:hypothetical protein ADICEAN_01169 [Cesiribacter andamanensis AMV16]
MTATGTRKSQPVMVNAADAILHRQYIVYRALAVMGKAYDQKNDQGNDDGGHRGPEHVPDVGKQVGTRHGRGQVGGIAQGRHLIPKIGTRDNSTPDQALRQAQRFTNAQQGNANGGDGRPGRARSNGDHRTYKTGRK